MLILTFIFSRINLSKDIKLKVITSTYALLNGYNVEYSITVNVVLTFLTNLSEITPNFLNYFLNSVSGHTHILGDTTFSTLI